MFFGFSLGGNPESRPQRVVWKNGWCCFLGLVPRNHCKSKRKLSSTYLEYQPAMMVGWDWTIIAAFMYKPIRLALPQSTGPFNSLNLRNGEVSSLRFSRNQPFAWIQPIAQHNLHAENLGLGMFGVYLNNPNPEHGVSLRSQWIQTLSFHLLLLVHMSTNVNQCQWINICQTWIPSGNQTRLAGKSPNWMEVYS